MAKSKIFTFKRLRDTLDYNPETGRFFTRPKEVGRSYAKGGYRIYAGYKQNYLAHRVAYFWMTGQWPPAGLVIDHINGDDTDNRWSNLRLATPTQNQRNRVRANKNNSTGLTGAYRVYRAKGNKGGKLWFSAIGNRHLGLFSTKEEAHEAYKKAAVERFGDFAPDRLKK